MRRALLGLAMASLLVGCTPTFQKCVKNYAEQIAAARIAAAVQCNGDKACVESWIATDVELFANEAAMCANADGGGQ